MRTSTNIEIVYTFIGGSCVIRFLYSLATGKYQDECLLASSVLEKAIKGIQQQKEEVYVNLIITASVIIILSRERGLKEYYNVTQNLIKQRPNMKSALLYVIRHRRERETACRIRHSI